MRHVLVPVLTPQDAEALPNLVQYLAPQKPLAVVVMHNPSLGVTGESATKDVDAKITATEKAETDAASRKDYVAAEQMRQQIEGLKLERQDVLREGWRKVSPEAREKAYSETILKPFVAAFGNSATHVRQITLLEDVPNENLFMTLANMGKAWPNCLPIGDFAVVYPRTIGNVIMSPTPNLEHLKEYWLKGSEPTSVLKPSASPSVAPNSPSEPSGGKSTLPAQKKAVANPVKARTVPSDPRAARDVELSRYMKLKQVAKQRGISLEGRNWKDVKNEILALEFPVAA